MFSQHLIFENEKRGKKKIKRKQKKYSNLCLSINFGLPNILTHPDSVIFSSCLILFRLVIQRYDKTKLIDLLYTASLLLLSITNKVFISFQYLNGLINPSYISTSLIGTINYILLYCDTCSTLNQCHLSQEYIKMIVFVGKDLKLYIYIYIKFFHVSFQNLLNFIFYVVIYILTMIHPSISILHEQCHKKLLSF